MVIKKEIPKTKDKPVIFNNSENEKMERVLIENFVSLQKVMTNLAIKFDSLSGQISKLLDLFEISAKTLAEKGGLEEGKEDKRVTEKLDNLLEQNKIIAKGIALLHETEPESETESREVNSFQRPQQSAYLQPPLRRIGGNSQQPTSQIINLSKDSRFNELN
jgi:hypothetical protein